MSLIYLLSASPRDPVTGLITPVRLAHGGRRAFNNFGSIEWWAGLERPPVIAESLGFDGEGFGEGAAASAFELVWRGNKTRTDTVSRLYWRDAPFTLHVGPEGGADADMSLIMSGRVVDSESSRGLIKLACADRSVDLAKPVITGTFAGTGGIEGDPETKGEGKWRAWGRCFNVTLRSFIKAHNIHVATDPARPIKNFAQVYDKGNAASALTIIPWAGSAGATLGALIAAVPPSGGAAVAPSIGSIKWWHGQPGKLTCDIEGEVGAQYVETAADIAAAIVGTTTIAVDQASLAAARIARADPAGLLISDASVTAAQALSELLGGASLWFSLSAAGAFVLGRYEWGPSVISLTSVSSEVVESFAPVDKVSVGYRKNQTVMSRGEIAEVVFAAEVSGLGALALQNAADFATQVTGGTKPQNNATVGAPAGTPVGTMTAEAVVSLARAGGLPGQNVLYNGGLTLGHEGWDNSSSFLFSADWRGNILEATPGTGGTRVYTSRVPINTGLGQPVTLSASFTGSATVNAYMFIDIEWRNGGNGALIGYSSATANGVIIFNEAGLARARRSQAMLSPNATDGSGFVRGYVRVVSISDVGYAPGTRWVEQIKVETGSVATAFSDEATDGANAAKLTGRLGSSAVLSTGMIMGVERTVSAIASATDQGGGTGCSINIPAHVVTYQGASGPIQVSYNSGTITSLAYSTMFFVYCVDPQLAGGAVTYIATTNPQQAQAASIYNVTIITTPAQGAPAATGSGGGGQTRPPSGGGGGNYQLP